MEKQYKRFIEIENIPVVKMNMAGKGKAITLTQEQVHYLEVSIMNFHLVQEFLRRKIK